MTRGNKGRLSRGRALGGRSMGRTMAACISVSLALVLLFATAAYAASPSWKLLAATGPTNIPLEQSESQVIEVAASGGSFKLLREPQSLGLPVVQHGELAFVEGSSQATIVGSPEGTGFEIGARVGNFLSLPSETRVESCTPDCSSPGATVTLSNAALSSATEPVEIFTHRVTNVTGEFAVGDEIQGVQGNYFPPGTVVESFAGGTMVLSNPTSAAYFSFSGEILVHASQATGPIAYDAPAGEVQNAIEGLRFFGPGSVSVTAGPGGPSGGTPYVVAFGGDLANRNIDTLAADETALTGEHHLVRISTTVQGGPGTGEISVNPTNIGGSPTVGAYTVDIGPLPSGVHVAGNTGGEGWNCQESGGTNVACTSEEVIPALTRAFNVIVPVEVSAPATVGELSTQVAISGGGSRPASFQLPIRLSNDRASAGVQAFWAGAFDSNGDPYTQAGGHPFSAQTYFMLNTIRSRSGKINPAGDARDVLVSLPPGFSGDPLATPRCPQSQLNERPTGQSPACNSAMQVGSFGPSLSVFGESTPKVSSPIYNDVPAVGSAAEFTTIIGGPVQSLLGSLRSSEDLGINIFAPNNPNYNKIYGGYAVLAGNPAGARGAPFLDNPTGCAVQRGEFEAGVGPVTGIGIDTWQDPLQKPLSELRPQRTDSIPVVTGCQPLTNGWLGNGPAPQNESPSFSFQPTSTQASSPVGATAVVHIPQAGLTDASKLRTSDLKKAIVTLPRGLNVNPASANGLQACSESQIGYRGSGFRAPNPMRFNEDPVTCPDASKLGTFSIKTPLLEEEVGGTIYLAAQEENPFHSLIALYLVVENERFGLNLKLPGEVRPDPTTGQLTAVFDNNPQLPFEDLTLHFRGGGGRATLATPETCGHFESTGSLEPWSAENGEALPIREPGFSISSGCASSDETRPFAPGFEAGTTGTKAGAYSPLVIKVSRKDGEQELKSLDFTLPKGLTGKLAGIPYCPEAAIANAEGKSGKAEQSSASCPSSSQIGTVDTSAGVGDEPIHVGGKVYLAGPYKGAPLSSVVVTPAVAGPFDLGDVVIRAPLYVDPETAEITAKSDPIPTILKGIPLKVRSVAVNLDRSLFTLNPTSCNVMLVSASIGGSSGATAKPANRFQVGGCNQLKFKPRLKIRLKGGTGRGGLPALKAVVTYPKKGAYANIRRAQVNLPHSEFLEQSNLNKTCTRPVLLEGKCPKSTIYGRAKAWTPLLEKPLQGPVYLVGGYGYKLPALVADLNGQIRILLKGKVDSGKNRGIRNTFEAVPDAPVSRFVLEMKGGKKYGLLINSENLCAKPQRAIARFTAQNGMVQQSKPKIANECGKRRKKHGNGKGHKSPGKSGTPKN